MLRIEIYAQLKHAYAQLSTLCATTVAHRLRGCSRGARPLAAGFAVLHGLARPALSSPRNSTESAPTTRPARLVRY